MAGWTKPKVRVEQAMEFPMYIPPQSIENEQSVLGAMAISREAIDVVTEIVSTQDFYRDSHQTIFDSMVYLSEKGTPVDYMTLLEELTRRGKLEIIGGTPYLTALLETVPIANNANWYAKIVRGKSILRNIIVAAYEINCLAKGDVDTDDIEEVVNQCQAIMGAVMAGKETSGDVFAIEDFAISLSDRIAEAQGHGISGLSTGLKDFDKLTNGLQKTDFIIIAAAPGMGKTSLVLSIAEHIALKLKKVVLIFSLEMSKEQLLLRLACSRAKVNMHKVNSGYATEDEVDRLNKAFGELYESTILICDRSDLSVGAMRLMCRKVRRTRGLDVVFVDYIGLMPGNPKAASRSLQIDEIVNGLKGMAKEFNIPVVGLSQLSRGIEKRQDKVPQISDLRDSGGSEAAADAVWFVYRESYYQKKESYAIQPASTMVPEEAFLIVGKYRNGPTGFVKVGFIAPLAAFVPLADLDGPTPI
jgi:replicative DNA helicase